MTKKFKIKNIDIGYNIPARVICEIGINHNGNLDKAIDLADKAIKAGAQIIKHQTHIAEEEMSDEAKKIIPANANEPIFSLIKKCSLNEIQEIKLKNYIEQKKRVFISTPFSFAAADRLNNMGVPAFKIGSGECNNYPLLKYVCRFKKPIIMSTGMNLLKDIEVSINILKKARIPFVVLHCTNIYPTPSKLIKIDTIPMLIKKFPNTLIGYSDHHSSIDACIAAISLGACLIEKHFVSSKNDKGPDVSASMNPQELNNLIKISNKIHLFRGIKKEISLKEKSTANFAFSSIVSKTDIKKNEYFSKKNLTLKRPGGGDFGPKDYEKLLGKKTNRSIKANKRIKKKMIK